MAVEKHLCPAGQKWQAGALSPLHSQMETTPIFSLPFSDRAAQQSWGSQLCLAVLEKNKWPYVVCYAL